MKLLGKIIYKTTIILIILGFLVNSFANLPFKKIQAQLGNLKSNEIVLNEEYKDGLEVIEEEIALNEMVDPEESEVAFGSVEGLPLNQDENSEL